MKAQRILRIAKKEILLKLRFKWRFFVTSIINPLKLVFLFFFVYTGFFSAGAKNIGGLTEGNYVVFLLLGAIFYNIFSQGFDVLGSTFLREKYWQTIQGLLISPATRLETILGIGIGGLVDIIPLLILSLGVSYILIPISIMKFLYILLLISITYLTVLGVGFIKATFVLSNENVTVIFDLIFWGGTFLSCFYYPITSLPKMIHPFVKLNPIYWANFVVKSIWMHGSFNLKSIIILSILAIVSLSAGIYIFNIVWKKIGIEGY